MITLPVTKQTEEQEWWKGEIKDIRGVECLK
jgi:hypothetical protein